MNLKKISVVIPVYNSANYLKATFDSLACQTMSPSDFEIICVNDCSTDNSRQVIEQHAAKMPNLTLINLPKNTGGPMIPRNTGVDAATGKYIHFMDSDDFLGEEALERLYHSAEKYQSDVIFGRHVGVNRRSVPKNMFGRGNVLQASLFTNEIVHSLAPHKMIRKSFLKKHDIRFHSGAKAPNEDQWFVMQCYIKARVVTILDDYDYYFVVARGNENFSQKSYSANEFFLVPNLIMEYTNRQVINPVENRKIKLAFLDRFFGNEVLRKRLFNPSLSTQEKKEWLDEGKMFLDKHTDDDLVKQMAPANQELARIVKDGNLQDVERVYQRTINKRQSPKNKIKAYLNDAKKKIVEAIVRSQAEKATLKTYIRPSVNAQTAQSRLASDQFFQVDCSITGWLEVRLPDKNGGTYAVFVNEKDIDTSFRFRILKSLKRMKRQAVSFVV